MSDALIRMVLGLASRFKDTHPNISYFVKSLRNAQVTDARFHLSSPEVSQHLAQLDSTALVILVELLDEVRLQGESKGLYREAAFLDLVSDRVKDKLSERRTQ